jgi:hypothetical protein
MSDLIIHNGLADRLREAASSHQQSVEEYLADLLERSEPGFQQSSQSAIVQAVEEYAMNLGVTDVSERSREILDTEWAEYLISRTERTGNE